MNEVLMIPAEEMGNLMNLYNQSKSICHRERVQVEQQKQLSWLEKTLSLQWLDKRRIQSGTTASFHLHGLS